MGLLTLFVVPVDAQTISSRTPAHRPASPIAVAASGIKSPISDPKSISWSLPPSKFVTALCTDLQGNLWTGTEDEGIWCSPATGGAPIQYLPKDGLGDEHCYALACDTQGRIWAGHQSHGVSVFNGQKWQNYEVVGGLSRPDSLNGPLGERIFDIAVCPTDGDVWMATSLGLTRYSVKTGQWSYITRMEGLPSDQIQCLAFERDGTLWVGTQCEGIAVAKSPYKVWRQIQGPDKPPVAAGGSGLPSSLINDILVSRDGSIWIGTTTGLAFSNNRGKSFSYLRGRDWIDKVKGLHGGAPKDWKQPEEDELAFELIEDYVTCLGQDTSGLLWIGHRSLPYEAIDISGPTRILPRADAERDVEESGLKEKIDCVTALLQHGDIMFSSHYGGGLQRDSIPLREQVRQQEQTTVQVETASVAPMPNAAMEAALETPRLSKLRIASPWATVVGDDWITKGDWIPRYGRHVGILAAANAPLDDIIQTDDRIWSSKGVGPNAADGEGVRSWIHWRKSDDPRVLYNPCLGIRRQAEWDDHGEVYSMSKDGPDEWVGIKVPAGVYRLSAYFFNKDGHTGNNRYRDYMIEVRTAPKDKHAIYDGEVLARSRVRDFWGGTYKQFAIVGPGEYLMLFRRNWSFNTITSGVFVDKLSGPAHESDRAKIPYLTAITVDTPILDRTRLSPELLAVADTMDSAKGQIHSRVSLIRACRYLASTNANPGNAQASFRWRIPLMTATDRTLFTTDMRKAFVQHLINNGKPETLKQWPGSE